MRAIALTAAVTCAIAPSALAQDRQDREAVMKNAAELARRAAAERLSISIDRLTVARTAPAEWRDSSLGCPERGKVYTPVLTSGYSVTLRDGDREHTVHVAGGLAVLCGSQGDPKQSPVPLLDAARKARAAVQAALGERLGIEEAEVQVVSTRAASSDAPACAAAPADRRGPAFIVEARAMNRTFWYYTDDGTTVACDAPAP